jgi:hypothetical protein
VKTYVAKNNEQAKERVKRHKRDLRGFRLIH